MKVVNHVDMKVVNHVDGCHRTMSQIVITNIFFISTCGDIFTRIRFGEMMKSLKLTVMRTWLINDVDIIVTVQPTHVHYVVVVAVMNDVDAP